MSNNEIEACQKKYKELEAGKSGIYNTIGRLYFEKYKDSPEGEFADSVNQINKINEEMKQIETLDTGKSLFFSHYSPETVEWFMSIV